MLDKRALNGIEDVDASQRSPDGEADPSGFVMREGGDHGGFRPYEGLAHKLGAGNTGLSIVAHPHDVDRVALAEWIGVHDVLLSFIRLIINALTAAAAAARGCREAANDWVTEAAHFLRKGVFLEVEALAVVVKAQALLPLLALRSLQCRFILLSSLPAAVVLGVEEHEAWILLVVIGVAGRGARVPIGREEHSGPLRPQENEILLRVPCRFDVEL